MVEAAAAVAEAGAAAATMATADSAVEGVAMEVEGPAAVAARSNQGTPGKRRMHTWFPKQQNVQRTTHCTRAVAGVVIAVGDRVEEVVREEEAPMAVGPKVVVVMAVAAGAEGVMVAVGKQTAAAATAKAAAKRAKKKVVAMVGAMVGVRAVEVMVTDLAAARPGLARVEVARVEATRVVVAKESKVVNIPGSLPG